MTHAMAECKEFAQEYYLSMLKELTRPPRVDYPRTDLGPRMFTFGATTAFREDWSTRNERGHNLEVSIWHHTTPRARGARLWESSGAPEPRILRCAGIVLYVHDMLGTKCNVTEVLAPLLACGCSVASLDCTASGRSEGTHITLGALERFDVAAVAAEIRLRYSVGGPGEAPLILFGRGAGAVACLLFADAADHRAQLARDDALALASLDGPPPVGGGHAFAGACFRADRPALGIGVSKPALRCKSVDPDSSAYANGLRVGDVVCGIDDDVGLPHAPEDIAVAFTARQTRNETGVLRVARPRVLDGETARRARGGGARPTYLILDAPWATVRGLVFDAIAASRSDTSDVSTQALMAAASPFVSASLPVVLHSIQKRSLADLGSVDARRAAIQCGLPALVIADGAVPERRNQTTRIIEALGAVSVLETTTSTKDPVFQRTRYSDGARIAIYETLAKFLSVPDEGASILAGTACPWTSADAFDELNVDAGGPSAADADEPLRNSPPCVLRTHERRKSAVRSALGAARRLVGRRRRAWSRDDWKVDADAAAETSRERRSASENDVDTTAAWGRMVAPRKPRSKSPRSRPDESAGPDDADAQGPRASPTYSIDSWFSSSPS